MKNPARLLVVSALFTFALSPEVEAGSEIYARPEKSVPSSATVASVPVSAVYFDTESYPHDAKTQLLRVASGLTHPSATDVAAWLESYSSSEVSATILKTYSKELLNILGIDPQKRSKWVKANRKLHKGIINYTGNSDESTAYEEGPDWRSINLALRSRQPLSAAEQKFFDEIQFSVTNLPQVKGLVFRGQKFSPERWAEVPEGSIWPQLAFTSTSLNYATARSFGAGYEGRTKTGIIIIKAKAGAPVSVLTFDNGAMGQPGRSHEHEILLPAGSSLFVHKKIVDTANDLLLVFAEQL